MFIGPFTPDTTQTTYKYAPLPHSISYADSSNESFIVAVDGKLSHLRFRASAAPGADKSWTFTIYKNDIATNLAVTIADDATTGEDTIHPISVSAGDRILILSTPSNTPAIAYVSGCMRFTGSGNQSIFGVSSPNPLNNGATEYSNVHGQNTSWDATESLRRQVIGASGTISDLHVRLFQADPGTSPDAYRFTLRKGGASQTLTVTITADDTTGSDTEHSFHVDAGDILTIMCEPLEGPANTPRASFGWCFTADNDNEFPTIAGGDSNMDEAKTKYAQISVCENSMFRWWNTETLACNGNLDAMTVKALYMTLSAAPGAGNKYDFTLRKNSQDTEIAFAISDSDTEGSDTGTVIVEAGDYLALETDPDSLPTEVAALYGFLCETVPEEVPGGSGGPAALLIATGQI